MYRNEHNGRVIRNEEWKQTISIVVVFVVACTTISPEYHHPIDIALILVGSKRKLSTSYHPSRGLPSNGNDQVQNYVFLCIFVAYACTSTSIFMLACTSQISEHVCHTPNEPATEQRSHSRRRRHPILAPARARSSSSTAVPVEEPYHQTIFIITATEASSSSPRDEERQCAKAEGNSTLSSPLGNYL